MFGPGSPNPFDAAFFYLQCAAMALWLLALATRRWQRRLSWRWVAALGLAVVSALLLPAIWNIGFPGSLGLDQGTRIIMAIPFMMLNAFFSCLWAVASAADVLRPKWPAARPFVVTASVGLLAWLLFWL
jgi:hypothetical protein